MPFLIDGHNLIAALPDLQLDDPHDEVWLVLRLRLWAAREGRKAVVVFDQGLPGGKSRALSGGGVEVVFASQGRSTADAVIRERLRRLRNPGGWTVVTSDREVQAAARTVGAQVMTSPTFAAQLAPPTPPETAPDKPEALSPAEMAEWLALFPEPVEEPPAVQPEAGRQQKAAGERKPKPQAEPPATPYGQKPAEVTPDEVEEWLRLFKKK